MSRFKISDTFLLDDKPIKILSGAIHYFRIPKDDWEDSLYNLKALGFNTVETYVPWNFHETIENEYDFKGHKDLKHFIELASKAWTLRHRTTFSLHLCGVGVRWISSMVIE